MARRFAVLLSAPGGEYVKKKYGGYFNLFVDLLSDSEEIWEMFRVYESEFPAVDELQSYHGFVVTGSKNDAHGDDDWVLKLSQFLRILHSMRLRVLGICFGYQLLCRALGGRSGRAPGGWDIGYRRITFSPALPAKFPGLESMPSFLNVIECHRDEVIEIPYGAEVLASSDRTAIEMFSLDQHILGIQGHPEYTADVLASLIEKLLDEQLITDQIREDQARQSVDNSSESTDKQNWQKICKTFLKSQAPQGPGVESFTELENEPGKVDPGASVAVPVVHTDGLLPGSPAYTENEPDRVGPGGSLAKGDGSIAPNGWNAGENPKDPSQTVGGGECVELGGVVLIVGEQFSDGTGERQKLEYEVDPSDGVSRERRGDLSTNFL